MLHYLRYTFRRTEVLPDSDNRTNQQRFKATALAFSL